MKKGDIAKFIDPLDENEARERFKLLEDPDGGRVLVEGICDMLLKPTRVLRIDDIEVDRKKMAFLNARLKACGKPCDKCGIIKYFPEGLGLYEEPFCEPVWLCEDCFPESDEDDNCPL